jgi:5-methyltetrahydrofolate--homocysteine methyltransferase
MRKEDRETLASLMGELDEMRVLEQVVVLQTRGVSPHDIFQALLDGVKEVDALYEDGRYFIADLVMAGHILKSVVSKTLGLRPNPRFGRILFAAVGGDDGGVAQSVAAEVLRQNAFDVQSMEEEAHGASLVAQVRAFRPHVLVLSGDRSGAEGGMAAHIRELEKAELRQGLLIFAGGPGITPQLAGEIGADAGGGTVMGCLRYCYERMASHL